MKETGQILKDAREKQNVGLAAVSAVTKINIKFLEAIEKADTENLPSKTFLRGFVQTYASFLKLDQSFVMDTFHREMGTTRYTPVIIDPNGSGGIANGAASVNTKATESVVAQSTTVSKPALLKSTPPRKHVETKDEGLAAANDQKTTLSRLFYAGIAIVLLVSIYAVFQLVQKYQQESQVPQPSPEIHTNAIPVTAPIPTPPPQEAEKPAEPVKPPEPKVEAKPEEKPEPKEVETKPSEPPKPAITPPAEAVKPSELPKPVVDSKPTQEVNVEALDSVKIDFRIDGGTLQSVTLQPEEKRIFRAKKNINIDVSDGGAVNVNHNGKDRGVPGNLGQSMKLSFP